MSVVVLNKDEARWFSRNVDKTHVILTAASKKDPTILERSTYLTLNALKSQAKEMAALLMQLSEHPIELELELSKKQKSVLSKMILDTTKHLEERVIPEYERRGTGFESYLTDVKNKIELLKTMVRKFK